MQYFLVSSGPASSGTVVRALGPPRHVNSGDQAGGEPGDEHQEGGLASLLSQNLPSGMNQGPERGMEKVLRK